MNKSLKASFALASLTAAFSCPTLAQSLPEIEDSITRGSQIDDIIDDQRNRQRAVAAEEDAIDGEAGIYILRRNEIFFVGGGLAVGYSTNPSRTSGDAGGSALASLAISAGIQTVVAEKFDVGVSVNVSGTDYEEDLDLSSRSLNSAVNIGTQVGTTPIYANISAFGGWSFDNSFEAGVAFYGISAAISAGLPIGKKTIIRPGFGLTRQWSQTSENNSTRVAASVDVVHAVAPRLTLGAAANISRVWFDDFYEDATFVKRTDWQYNLSASLSYRLSDKANLGVSTTYEKRTSSFFLSAYDSFDAAASLSLRVRF